MTEKPEGFSNQQILTANVEVLRFLITLLLGKRMVTEPELQLIASSAKQGCAHRYPPQIAGRAADFVDVLLGGLPYSSSKPS